MKPLLEIQTVPILIEFKTTPAQLNRAESTAELEISRRDNNVQIKSRPIRLNLDTFETSGSFTSAGMQNQGLQGMQKFNAQNLKGLNVGEDGKPVNLQYSATIHMANQTDLMLNVQTGQSAGQESQWAPESLQIQYAMDKLNFDWKVGQGNMEFTPASIEFEIKQYPKVVIEYIGGPIYVPPSADPEYVPLDERA